MCSIEVARFPHAVAAKRTTWPTLLAEQARPLAQRSRYECQFLQSPKSGVDTMEPMKVQTTFLSSLPLGLDFEAALRDVVPAKVQIPGCNDGSVAGQSVAAGRATSEVERAFDALLRRANEVTCDVEGRVALENLLEVATRSELLALMQRIRGSVLPLSMDAQGCRLIQKLLQVLPSEGQCCIADALSKDIRSCIESRHGNFVVQACIEQLPVDAIGFIIQAVEMDPKEYATHKFGCRVIQRLVEHCPTQKLVHILGEVLDGTVELSKNQYGCHVLRCILEHARSEDKLKIFQAMRINILKLSRNRLSASVVEKCLEVASEQPNVQLLMSERLALMRAVFFCGSVAQEGSEKGIIVDMTSTRFGRSILRRMIEAATVEERAEILPILTKACPCFRLDNAA